MGPLIFLNKTLDTGAFVIERIIFYTKYVTSFAKLLFITHLFYEF
jgi:hypothetical protein